MSMDTIHHDIDTTVEEMSQLRVPELKAVCRSIGLALTGRKADLQDRIKAYLNNATRSSNVDYYRSKAILTLIQKSKIGEPLPSYESIWQSLRTGAYTHPVATGEVPHISLNIKSPIHVQDPKLTISFKESPFYRLKRMIQESPKLASRSTGRGVCGFKFKLNEIENQLLSSGDQYQLYMFCGLLNPLGNHKNIHIQFPHPNEIKFNDVMIKDNVRGLKNQVGTAKPAILTPYIKFPPFENNLQLIYAFTKDDYLVYLYIVEVITIQEILEKVKSHPRIVKPATLQYIKKTLTEEEDEELMTTSTIMTLQCPISYSRMEYPVKSIYCHHLQCFDALWFIESQKQVPTWKCPVCQKSIYISDLAICEFVQEIIQQCSDDIEQVEIRSDGSWIPIQEDEGLTNKSKNLSDTHHQNVESTLKREYQNDILLEDSPIRQSINEPVVISLDSDEEEEEEEDSSSSKTTTNLISMDSTTPIISNVPEKLLYTSHLDPSSASNVLPVLDSNDKYENGMTNINNSVSVPETSFIDSRIPNNPLAPINNYIPTQIILNHAHSSKRPPLYDQSNIQNIQNQPPLTNIMENTFRNELSSDLHNKQHTQLHIPQLHMNLNVRNSSLFGNIIERPTEYIEQPDNNTSHSQLGPDSSNVLGLSGDSVKLSNGTFNKKLLGHTSEGNQDPQAANILSPMTGRLVPMRQSPPIERPILPPLPPLPSIDHKGSTISSYISCTEPQSADIQGTMATTLKSHNSRQKKPPVSPFLPKRYTSLVPKKRVHSHED